MRGVGVVIDWFKFCVSAWFYPVRSIMDNDWCITWHVSGVVVFVCLRQSHDNVDGFHAHPFWVHSMFVVCDVAMYDVNCIFQIDQELQIKFVRPTTPFVQMQFASCFCDTCVYLYPITLWQNAQNVCGVWNMCWCASKLCGLVAC